VQSDLFLLEECFRSFGVLPGAVMIEEDGVCGVTTGIPHNFFNGVVTTRPQNERAVENVVSRFRANQRPFRWWVTPDGDPPHLAPLLLSHGLRQAFESTGMWGPMDAMRLDLREAADVTIRRVTNLAEMQIWADVLLAGFGLPASDASLWLAAYERLGLGTVAPWAHFIAFLHDEPVATSSVLLRGELAGIYHVVTLPAARGRGIGSVITVAALRHASDAGATVAALQASEMGFNVYRAIGFGAGAPLTMLQWRPEYA
jgi:GNAT superfamily N-acetyltransferase